MEVELCYYCGVLANSVDHVVPNHLLKRAGDAGIDLSKVMRIRLLTVPACRECNSLIGGAVFKTLPERVAYAKKQLRKKYQSYLRIPTWTEQELSEMGPNAQRDISAALRVQESARQRIAFRSAVSAVDLSAVYELYSSIAAIDASRSRTGEGE